MAPHLACIYYYCLYLLEKGGQVHISNRLLKSQGIYQSLVRLKPELLGPNNHLNVEQESTARGAACRRSMTT